MKLLSDRRFINYPMLLKVIGWLLMIESMFMLVPVVTALIYGEDDWLPFTVTMSSTTLVGWLMARKIKASTSRMGRREGFLLTGGVWIVFSLFGMIPMIFSSLHLSVTDAFFETMSGFTTTGASVFTERETLSHATHIWLAMMQWIGGMGIILFTLAVLPMLNSSGGMQMFNAEVTGITHDKVRPRISQTAKTLWLVYIALTIAAIVLLAFRMNLFDSICHAFGTVSTGGYSTKSDNIQYYNSTYVDIVILIFMFLGGTNFTLMYRTTQEGPKALWQSEIFRAYVYSVVGMTVLSALAVINNHAVTGWRSLTIEPLFQVVSAYSSTGYTLDSIYQWGPFYMGLLFAMIFIGGCAGSTSGGSKLDRAIFVAKHCINELNRCVRPNAVFSVKMNGRVQPPALVNKVVAFMCIYVSIIIISGVLLMAFGISEEDAFFTTLCCVSNSGFGVDVANSGAAVKWLLSAVMLIGRLEIFTILILFTPSFWKK